PSCLLVFLCSAPRAPRYPHSFPTRRSSDLDDQDRRRAPQGRRRRLAGRQGARSRRHSRHAQARRGRTPAIQRRDRTVAGLRRVRSEEHTSELQSRSDLVCRLLLEKKKKYKHVRRVTTRDAWWDESRPKDLAVFDRVVYGVAPTVDPKLIQAVTNTVCVKPSTAPTD